MSLSFVEQQVMLAALRLTPEAYGVNVRDEIERVAKKRYSFGTIYAALERLKELGYLTSREGPASTDRGGRRKLFFEINAPGNKALSESLRAADALREGTPFGGRAWA